MSDKLDRPAGRLLGTLARTEQKMQIGLGKRLFMNLAGEKAAPNPFVGIAGEWEAEGAM